MINDNNVQYNMDNTPDFVHIWIGSFKSEDELDECVNGCFAGAINDLSWQFNDKEMCLQDFIMAIPVEDYELKDAIKEKYPDIFNSNPIKVNSWIVFFGWRNKNGLFYSNLTYANLFYLGEFDIIEPDTEGQYDAWI